MASSSNTFVENWSDADHDNIFINKILQSGELKQQFLEDFTLFHYQLPIGMPNDVRVELNAKHDGESTMQAALDFLHKGLANCLEEGWSRKVLEALKENNQAHLSELFKPTESDRENYLQHKKKLEEAEKRRKEQKKAESADDNAKQGMTSNIQKNDGNIVQQFIKVHGGATVHIGGHISGEQSKISNKSDEFSEHDSESLADLVRKGQSKSRKSSSVSEKSIVMDNNSIMEILRRNNNFLTKENKNLENQLNSQKESFNRDVAKYEDTIKNLTKNISDVSNENQKMKVKNEKLQKENKKLKDDMENLKQKHTIDKEKMSAEIKQLKIEKQNKKEEQNKIKEKMSAEIKQLKNKLQYKEEEQNKIKEKMSAEIKQLKNELQDKEEKEKKIKVQKSAEIEQLKNEMQDKEEEQNKITEQMSAEIKQLKNELQDKEEKQNKIAEQISAEIKQIEKYLQNKKIMLFGGKNNPRSCYSFSFSSQQWTKLPDLPSDRNCHGLAVIGQSAYLVGGYNNKDIDEYNLTTKKIRKMNSMKTNRRKFGICVHTEHKILITGGWENGSTDSCFLYDTIENTFETIGSLNTGRHAHVVVNEGNTAYAIGGLDTNNKILNTIEVLNETTQKWKLLETTLLIPRYFHQAVVHKNSIYIIGGKDGSDEQTDTIEKFDLLTERIDFLNVKLKIARSSPAVAKYMNDLYIIGGYTGNGKTSTVEIFDLDKEEMREGKELPVADYAFTACVL